MISSSAPATPTPTAPSTNRFMRFRTQTGTSPHWPTLPDQSSNALPTPPTANPPSSTRTSRLILTGSAMSPGNTGLQVVNTTVRPDCITFVQGTTTTDSVGSSVETRLFTQTATTRMLRGSRQTSLTQADNGPVTVNIVDQETDLGNRTTTSTEPVKTTTSV